MQFVKHGNKFKVVRYAGFDRDKKRPILEIVGTLDLGGCCGLKLSAAMQSGKLKESELQEIEAKKRELREAHRLASIPELPYVLENALTLIVSLTPEEWAAQDATWQRLVAHNGRMFAEILDQLGAPHWTNRHRPESRHRQNRWRKALTSSRTCRRSKSLKCPSSRRKLHPRSAAPPRRQSRRPIRPPLSPHSHSRRKHQQTRQSRRAHLLPRTPRPKKTKQWCFTWGSARSASRPSNPPSIRYAQKLKSCLWKKPWTCLSLPSNFTGPASFSPSGAGKTAGMKSGNGMATARVQACPWSEITVSNRVWAGGPHTTFPPEPSEMGGLLRDSA